MELKSGGRHRARSGAGGSNDAWDRSHHYLPPESRMELTRVGEERKERPLEEGEEGEAFTVPVGGFATLSFEGLSSLRRASGRAGPRGAHRGSRRPSAERATTPRLGRSPSGTGRPWGLRRRWHAPDCSKGEP